MSASKCTTEGCDLFGNADNNGRCNHCAKGWTKPPLDKEEEPPAKKTRTTPPVEAEADPTANQHVVQISAEEYKTMSPQERAAVTSKQLALLFSEVEKRKPVYRLGCEMRKAIETTLNIKPTCPCESTSFLGVSSRACDGNYYTLPSGKQGEGYLPSFSGVGALGGDGANFDMCTECGRIYGFDKEEMQTEIDRLENEEDD